jgi:hypothetical protein
MTKREVLQNRCRIGFQREEQCAEKDEYHRRYDIIKLPQVQKGQGGRLLQEAQDCNLVPPGIVDVSRQRAEGVK